VPPSGGVAGVPFYPRVAKYLWALGNLYTGEVERAKPPGDSARRPRS